MSPNFFGLFVEKDQESLLKKLTQDLCKEIRKFGLKADPIIKSFHLTLAYRSPRNTSVPWRNLPKILVPWPLVAGNFGSTATTVELRAVTFIKFSMLTFLGNRTNWSFSLETLSSSLKRSGPKPLMVGWLAYPGCPVTAATCPPTTWRGPRRRTPGPCTPWSPSTKIKLMVWTTMIIINQSNRQSVIALQVAVLQKWVLTHPWKDLLELKNVTRVDLCMT